MRTLIVCESMFGNTRQIAGAVAETLSAYSSVDIVDVASAPLAVEADVELLVVGAPTHAFGMSRPSTRRSAADQGATVDTTVGIREWLATMKASTFGTCVGVFDTRIARPRLPGSAARAARRRLERLGFNLLSAPMSFWVQGTTGPMLPGELERAHRWSHQLGTALRARRLTEQRRIKEVRP